MLVNHRISLAMPLDDWSATVMTKNAKPKLQTKKTMPHTPETASEHYLFSSAGTVFGKQTFEASTVSDCFKTGPVTFDHFHVGSRP